MQNVEYMPPKTEYALIGYGVALFNGYTINHIFRTLGWGPNGGVLMLEVMALTVMSWFYWMHRQGHYDEIPKGETVID